MAAVDAYSPAAVPATIAVPAGECAVADFTCNACSEIFSSAAEQRSHCKTERHVYNTKRRLAGLKPISQEAWERKLKESRVAGAGKPQKGTAHIKAGKEPRGKAGSEASSNSAAAPTSDAAVPAEGAFAPPERTAEEGAPKEEEAAQPFSPRRSLFDRRHFGDVEDTLKYMWKNFDFQVPDREYCTDLNGLLGHLWEKINEPPHACLFCNRKFPDAAAVRKHMLDKRHSRIGTEARTRRGTDSKQDLQAELEDFYDFHGSTREVTERITDPRDRVACILRFFDADRDGYLSHAELSELWGAASRSASASSAATQGEGQGEQGEGKASAEASAEAGEAPALSEVMYKGACAKAGADPEEGLDTDALERLYDEGLADLDTHFKLLQDLLTQKLASRSKKPLKSVGEKENEDEDDDDDDDDDAAEGEESEDDDDDADSDTTEVIECEDEDEFEEVMRVLGLVSAEIMDNGDIRLPSGRIAINRDVAHIWKQRGTRFTGELVLAGSRPKERPMFALSNGDSCSGKVAMTIRQVKCENKKVIAVLKKSAVWDMKMGIKNNKMQRKCLKIRTGLGDASGGR